MGLTDRTRWQGFALRDGDIIISTPSKCGTTWAQMICALLIFRTPEPAAPLTTLSPWLDMRLRPVDEVVRLLEGQRHRRFIKTHTPLEALPGRNGVTYLVVGRDALDVAVSMGHHQLNLDEDAIRRLLGAAPAQAERRGSRERLLRWIDEELGGLVDHLGQAWARRADQEVVLVHYADLSRDLAGEMGRIADRLGLEEPTAALVEAARFGAMKSRADQLAPDERLGLFVSRDAFFRSGQSGQWREVLTDEDLACYRARLRSLGGPDFVAWVTHGRRGA